jgi:hypothetical protein
VVLKNEGKSCISKPPAASDSERAFSPAGRPNVVNFTLHGTRYSSATSHAREGTPERQLKAIAGWKWNVVSRHVQLAAEGAQALVARQLMAVAVPGNHT